jgi:hypothetical protein
MTRGGKIMRRLVKETGAGGDIEGDTSTLESREKRDAARSDPRGEPSPTSKCNRDRETRSNFGVLAKLKESDEG